MPCRGSLSLALAATESWWPGRRLQPRSRRNRGGHGFQVPTANHGSRTGPGPRSRRQPGVTSRQVNCRPLQARSAGVSGAGTMCPNLDLPVIRASVSGPDRAFGTRRLGHLNLPPARQVTVGAQAGMTLTILNQMSVLPSRLHGLGSCKNRGSGWAPPAFFVLTTGGKWLPSSSNLSFAGPSRAGAKGPPMKKGTYVCS